MKKYDCQDLGLTIEVFKEGGSPIPVFVSFCICLLLSLSSFVFVSNVLSPGRPADNGRVQGGKQGGPKNCAGAVDTDAGKR